MGAKTYEFGVLVLNNGKFKSHNWVLKPWIAIVVEAPDTTFKSHNWVLKPDHKGNSKVIINLFKSHNWVLKHLYFVVLYFLLFHLNPTIGC